MSIELGREEDLKTVPTQEEVNEKMDAAKSEKIEEPVDYTELDVYKNVIINFEKLKAVSLDLIFDDKYMTYGLCATSLTHTSENKEAKSLRMNAVEELIQYLSIKLSALKEKITFIKDIKEISCFEELYNDEKVLEDSKKHRKIVVTFENDDIKDIYVYKMASFFTLEKSLISLNNTIQANKNEIMMKNFIQNFMMNMSAMNQQRGGRTPGGIIRP
jgi:hypothetical protein